MQQAACFTREQILDYSLGRVSADEERLIAEHLEQCSDCQEAASQCDHSADSLVAALREPQDASSLDDPFCREALARAARHAPGASLDRTEPIRLREYELLRKLGEGGMGTVYQARHTRLGKIVALKILPPDRMRDPSAVARFEREMRAVGALDDPAIVRATDAGDVDGTHFLVMEYVAGLDLSSLAERLGPIGIADACELVRQAALGLQHVHERGMVHRDIKPSNLMLTPRGEVKTLDLGLALLQGSDGDAQEVTTVGRFMGTLDYMAPEQADDSHEVDIRADVYGLGATLYRLICGVPPFAGKEYRSPLKKLKALAIEPVPPVRERRPDVPAPLAQIIERMLAKEPADRFATPADVAEAMQPFAAASDLAKLQRSGPAVEHARRSRRHVAVILLALAALLAAAAIYVETDKGTLVIKSPDPGLEVLIRRGGDPVDDWELQRGQNRTTVRSGSYEIVLIGETDGLRVKDGAFTLTRGGEQVVVIERVQANTVRSSDLLNLGQQPVPPDAPDAQSQRISQRNLRRLGIAMHDYHDKRDRFPPAVVLGPDGKTPHSWRVALLPHLGYGDLYKQYRLDEPWDSEHNRKLLETMPDIYRHPTAPVDTTNAAYFVITSPTAAEAVRATEGMAGIFEGYSENAIGQAGGLPPVEPAQPAQRFEALFSSVPQKTGPRIRDITDGTSNVLLIVEDRRDVPWTRPEDIPYRPGAAPPQIGGWWEGGFYAAFADGDVRFVADSLDRETLRKLIAPADGHPVDLKSIGTAPAKRALPDRPVAPAAVSENQAIRGVWNVVGVERNGKPVDPQEVADRQRSFLFTEEHFLIRDRARVEAAGTYSLQADGDRIILLSEQRDGEGKRRRIYGRYELKGDDLRLALSNEDFPPLSMAPPDAKIEVYVLRRVEVDESGDVPTLAPLAEPRDLDNRRDQGKQRTETDQSQLLYGGKAFREWAAILKSERSATLIVEAMLALEALGEGGQAAEAAELVLEKVKRYSEPWVFGGSPEGEIRQTAMYVLQQLGSDATVEVLSRRLAAGTSRERAYALYALSRQPVAFMTGPNEWVTSTVIDASIARAALPAILAASSDPDPQIRKFALTLAAQLAPEGEAVRDRLEEALDDPQTSVAYTAAGLLADHGQKSPQLVETVLRMLRDGGASLSAEQKAEIATKLAQVAPDTQALVPELIKLLEQTGTDRSDLQAHGQALIALKYLGPNAADAVSALNRLARSQNAYYASWPSAPNAGYRPWPPGVAPANATTIKPIAELAIEALAAMGPAAADPEVIVTLERLRESKGLLGEDIPVPVSVRKAAAKALETIILRPRPPVPARQTAPIDAAADDAPFRREMTAGASVRSWKHLGLKVAPAAQHELGPQNRYAAGLAVTGVRASSPAASAGIRLGDVLVELGASTVTNIEKLDAVIGRTVLQGHHAVRFKLLRAGEQRLGMVEFSDGNDETVAPRNERELMRRFESAIRDGDLAALLNLSAAPFLLETEGRTTTITDRDELRRRLYEFIPSPRPEGLRFEVTDADEIGNNELNELPQQWSRVLKVGDAVLKVRAEAPGEDGGVETLGEFKLLIRERDDHHRVLVGYSDEEPVKPKPAPSAEPRHR